MDDEWEVFWKKVVTRMGRARKTSKFPFKITSSTAEIRSHYLKR
jgi:hypothetical protein